MRKILTIALLLGSWGVMAQQAPVKVAEGYKVEIKTSAVCDMCKERIEKDLTFEKGVKSAVLDVDSKVVTVVYNNQKTNPETIRKRIATIGYDADNVNRDEEAHKKLPFCCQSEDQKGKHK